MTGINQGRPEMAIGEPIRLGSNNEFEIEQHPVSDRLIIRDTVNGKVAYVRKERGGQIGGDGVLVKSLKEGKPVADDGRTHDTIQAAERAASGWVFVPPGTFNESVEINTDGLTLRGSGYNTYINPPDSLNAIKVDERINMTIENLSCDASNDKAIDGSFNTTVENVTVKGRQNREIGITADTVINSRVESSGNEKSGFNPAIRGIRVVNCYIDGNISDGIATLFEDVIFANNVVRDARRNIVSFTDNSVIIGNRLIDAVDKCIQIESGTNNCIVANNRASDAGSSDILDNGTGTILDGNLTGASN